MLTGVETATVAHADGAFTRRRSATASSWSPSSCSSPPAARPNLDDLGLETVGPRPGRAHASTVDERMRAGERLWAIGDITGKGAFTHVSMYQSAVALRDILGEDGPPARLPRRAARDVHRSRGRRRSG